MFGTCCVHVCACNCVLRATAACPCSCFWVHVYLHCLSYNLRFVEYVSTVIMQLACVFKYILEFSTLVETTRRATLSSSFFHSEFRSRSPILVSSRFSRSRPSFTFTHEETAYLHFPPDLKRSR